MNSGQVTVDRKGRTVVLTTPDARRTTHAIPTVAAWSGFAKKIAKTLRPGDILALSGELGAGKTTFVQALATAFGIARLPPSPTFALMRSYAVPRSTVGIRRLIHVDAYRIEDERDLIVLDLDEELADGESVLVLEWPENVPDWIERHRITTLRITG